MEYLAEITGAYAGFSGVISEDVLRHDLTQMLMRYTGSYYPVEIYEQDRDEYSIIYIVEVPWRLDDKDWLGCSAMGDLLVKAIGMQGEEVDVITVDFYDGD